MSKYECENCKAKRMQDKIDSLLTELYSDKDCVFCGNSRHRNVLCALERIIDGGEEK